MRLPSKRAASVASGMPWLKRGMSQLSIEPSTSRTDPFFIPLLGPPEIYLSSPPPPSQAKTATDDKASEDNMPCSASEAIDDHNPPPVSDPFMDAMVANYNKQQHIPPWPNMGFTENRSPTFLSSGNPCLDFFFHVVPDTPRNDLEKRLQSAWEQDPLTALKLVFNLRGVRGTGKGEREGFYASALWLHEKHPKTLACNTKSVAEFGYFKDLPEILFRLLEGPDVRENEKRDIKQRKMFYGESWYLRGPKSTTEKHRIEAGKKSVERYNSDPVYRFLHNKVSDLFAEALKCDVENLKAGKHNCLSFAAKWCPSLYSAYDRSTLLCESIARKLFPRDLPEYKDIEEAHYAYRIRDRLRKEVLVPLRKALKLPEVYMAANQWSELPYNRVPSIAMKNYTDLFRKHDPVRFRGFLERVKSGKAKISAGALLPHEIIASLKPYEHEVAELQWQRIVDDLSAIGKLKNCLAISDVSGSMSNTFSTGKKVTPLDVSVALGLLVSELSEEPWKGKVITFSNNPQLQIVEGDNLLSKVRSIKRMDWEMNTNFQRVFDKLLEVAKEGNLSEDQMIQRLFVFSDMEFDEASANSWETDYEAICRKFRENGYSSVPEIVFWNLRNSDATPVPSHQKGVALVSGFSKNLLKLFLENGGELNPEDTMKLAIAGEEYNKLMVVD